MKPASQLDPASPETLKRNRTLYYWLLLAVFMEYARPLALFPNPILLKLNSIIPLLLLLVTFFAKGLRPMREIMKDPMGKWPFIYVVLILISVFTALLSQRTRGVFETSLGYLLLYIMISRIVITTGQLRGVVWTLALAHAFLIMMNPLVVTAPEARHYVVGGTFLGDGNDFALSLCVLLPLLIEVALASKSKSTKFMTWGVSLLFVLAIIGTQSRGAFLGVIAVFFVLWLRSKRKLVTMIGVAFLGGIFALYAPDEYFERMNTIKDYQTEGSAQGRIMAWKAGTQMALDHPLTGVSAGNFPIAFGMHYAPKDKGPLPWLTAHSIYFLTLGELGFPGIITLLVLILGTIRANTRLRRKIEASLNGQPDTTGSVLLLLMLDASTIGFAAAGAFLSASYYPHIFVVTAFGIVGRDIATRQTGIAVTPQASPEAAARPSRTPPAAPLDLPSRSEASAAHRSERPRWVP